MAQQSAAETALETQKIGSLQIRVAVLCGLVQLFDGYDITSIGMAAPSLARAWGLPPAAFAQAFVISSVGILVGALLSGPLGDRLGRKPILVASVAIIGVFSLLSVFAPDLTVLTTLRFFTGLGLGGAMPATVALTSDYAPQRHRATFIMFMFCGNTAGGFLGGQLVARMLPQFGWQSIFVVGGAVPLILLPVLMLWLPESARFLLHRGRTSPGALRLFARLGVEPAAALGNTRTAEVDVATGNPVIGLFADGFALRTILLWIVFFANLLDLYLLSYWLPTVLTLSGLKPEEAVFAASMLTGGGILSILFFGPLADRFGAERVVAVSLASGAFFIAALGLMNLPYGLVLAAIFGAGAATIGSQLAANGMAAVLYPARIRSTGVGWALGIGRFGGIAGPAIGGVLLAMGWPPKQIFLCACGTALLAAFCTGLLSLRASPARRVLLDT